MDSPINKLRSEISKEFQSLKVITQQIEDDPPCSQFWNLEAEANSLFVILDYKVAQLNEAAEANKYEYIFREVFLHEKRLNRLRHNFYINVEKYTLAKSGVTLPKTESIPTVWIVVSMVVLFIVLFTYLH